jgi:ribosomal protein S18 acetylase RimI-like enzyme
VADLVEICFRDTLDPDGERYLRQMRQSARSPFLSWLSLTMRLSHMPNGGFVWEQDGRLVGNLTLIPFSGRGFLHYLVANVAVHPDYRGRGIGRALTARALEFARQRGVPRVWLQVRQGNGPAIRIYESLGFKEMARRTTWFFKPRTILPQPPSDIQCLRPQARDWPLMKRWLRQSYPLELTWQLPIDLNNLRPDFWGSLYLSFSGAYVHQWAARRNGQLLGVLAWQSMPGSADSLWFGAPRETEDEALYALLSQSVNQLTPHRGLSLDYPVEQGAQALRAAGFQEYQTLIWMLLTLRG